MTRRRRRRKLATKRERASRAALGGSAVARETFNRPGGTHRTQPTRSTERDRAIREGNV